MNVVTRGAAAGAAGAIVWALADPLLAKALGTRFTDARLAGRLVSAGRRCPAAGVVLHTALGSALGAALAAAGLTTPRRALVGAQAENLATWPLLAYADRRLPRGSDRDRTLLTSRRAFAQSSAGRTVFAVCFARSYLRLIP